jgi:ribonuclease III, bacterial
MNKINLTEFEEKIKYSFNNKDTLLLAFTHSSYANEHNLGKFDYNERLEFLGDAALDLVISKFIYMKFPEMPEGELTKLRAGVVCEGSLAKKAREIGLGKFLQLGKGEEITGGRDRESVLADAFEAVIGAICIDGGMPDVEKYVLSLMTNVVEELKSSFRNIDYKTRLQELIQKTSRMPVSYAVIGERGPDHGKEFIVEVYHNGNTLGMGVGKSKKEAEQSAAGDAIKHMNS